MLAVICFRDSIMHHSLEPLQKPNRFVSLKPFKLENKIFLSAEVILVMNPCPTLKQVWFSEPQILLYPFNVFCEV